MVLDNVVLNKVLDIKNVVGSDLKTFIFNNNEGRLECSC